MKASTRKVTSARSGADPSRGGELRHKANPRLLALTAIGVVFGDIGTSPLYTLSVTLSASGQPVPTAVDVLGIISLIFWALMAMVSLKYVVLVLRADNDGEGGILALLSLVARYRGRRFALWRRHHHAGHFRAFRRRGPQARHAGARRLRLADYARNPDRAVRDAAPRHCEHRPPVRPGHGRLVRRDRVARRRQYLGGARNTQSAQSA